MRVLVTGGRHYDDREAVHAALDAIPVSVLIEGGATGADRLARSWAIERGVAVETYPADWATWGRKAGPIRNARMLNEGRPDLVVAFPGGRGTANMVSLAGAAGVEVRRAG